MSAGQGRAGTRCARAGVCSRGCVYESVYGTNCAVPYAQGELVYGTVWAVSSRGAPEGPSA